MRRSFVALIILSYVIALARMKVFIIPFSHLDIGFTATQREVSQQYASMFRKLIDVLDRVPDFCFTVESFWQFQQWLNSKPSQEEIDKFRQYVSNGRIEFASAFANMHTGFLNKLILRESIEFPLRELRKLGFDAKVCFQNDVPGFSEHLPDVLHDLGIKYLMIGINDGYASVLGTSPSASVFWWEGPRGGRVLTYVTKKSYAEGVTIRTAAGFEYFVESVVESGYPYHVLPILVAFDNAGYEPGIMALLRFGRVEYENMDVVVSTPSKFFEELEKRYSDFPTYRGDWSGWWEVVKAGAPYSSSTAKWVQDSLEDLVDLGLVSKNDKTYDHIVEKLLLYGEHSSACGAGWPGLLSIEQIAESNETVVSYAREAYEEIQRFLQRKFSNSVGEYVLISRAREVMETTVKIPYEHAKENDVAIIELNGGEYLAWRFSEPATNAYEPFSGGFKFHAPLNPGENRLKITRIESIHFPIQKTHQIENAFYRVNLHPDGTFDIFDKQFERIVLSRAGKIEINFTINQGVLEVLPVQVTSAFSVEYPQEIVLYASFGTDFPFEGLKVILPPGKKAVIVEYFMNRDKLPHVPYEKHSVNYYVCFSLPDATEILCVDVDGTMKQTGLFPFVRPRELCLNGYVLGDAGTFKYLLASREAFMVDLPFENERDKVVRFHLLRHYSEAATKDKVIMRLERTEPNTPSMIRFSLFISTQSIADSETVRDFLRPPIVVQHKGVMP